MEGDAPGSPEPSFPPSGTRCANGWPTPQGGGLTLSSPLSSRAPLDSLRRRNVSVCFHIHRLLKVGRPLGGAVAPESPPPPPPPGVPFSSRARVCASAAAPRPGQSAGRARGPRLCSGARWPPPGATPCGPGLNLDSAGEPETRERGRKPGKTRGSRNAQQLLRCPGRGDFWRARGRVQNDAAKGHVFSADRPCIRVDNSENRTQKSVRRRTGRPGRPHPPANLACFWFLPAFFCLSPFKMEVEIQFSCLSLLLKGKLGSCWAWHKKRVSPTNGCFLSLCGYF